jgi:hypothetical protein
VAQDRRPVLPRIQQQHPGKPPPLVRSMHRHRSPAGCRRPSLIHRMRTSVINVDGSARA